MLNDLAQSTNHLLEIHILLILSFFLSLLLVFYFSAQLSHLSSLDQRKINQSFIVGAIYASSNLNRCIK